MFTAVQAAQKEYFGKIAINAGFTAVPVSYTHLDVYKRQGTDGTPLYSANELDVDVSWLSPQSEYRPTEYLQQWVSFWFVEDKRLAAAKRFQLIRLTPVSYTHLDVYKRQQMVLAAIRSIGTNTIDVYPGKDFGDEDTQWLNRRHV